jgi:DNA-binding PadR family transcriptional regulator
MPDPADREIRLALWKLHVLHHATRRPVYGLWLLEELREHGHRLSPGTLYPILERMERNGWLRSASPRRANARRNYRITARGRRLLAALRADVQELHRELVLGVEPQHRSGGRQAPARPARSGRSVPGARGGSSAGEGTKA